VGRRLLAAEFVNEEQILEQAFMFFDRDGNKEISIAGTLRWARVTSA
jgi:hypothetical protein